LSFRAQFNDQSQIPDTPVAVGVEESKAILNAHFNDQSQKGCKRDVKGLRTIHLWDYNIVPRGFVCDNMLRALFFRARDNMLRARPLNYKRKEAFLPLSLDCSFTFLF